MLMPTTTSRRGSILAASNGRFRIIGELAHGVDAQIRLGAHARARQLVADEKIARHEPHALRQTVGHAPRQKADDGRAPVACNAFELGTRVVAERRRTQNELTKLSHRYEHGSQTPVARSWFPRRGKLTRVNRARMRILSAQISTTSITPGSVETRPATEGKRRSARACEISISRPASESGSTMRTSPPLRAGA